MSGKSFTRKLDSLADGVLALLGVTLVGLVLVSVFFRYVLNSSLSWSDEVVRYLFVWFTLFGAAVTLREREHIRVEYFVEKLPRALRRCVEMAMLLGVIVLQLALVVFGSMWVWTTRGSYTSTLQWPLNILFYAALPTTALLTLWYAWRRWLRGEYAESDVAAEELAEAMGEGGACNS